MSNPVPERPAPEPAPRATTIGHVHLKVADLERAIAFYSDILGFDLMQRYGRQAAFLGAGGYHHRIGLNTWESPGQPPPPGHTSLYHSAFLYPDRRSLAQVLTRVLRAGIPLDGAADHGSARRSTCAAGSACSSRSPCWSSACARSAWPTAPGACGRR